MEVGVNWTWIVIVVAVYMIYWGYKEYRKRHRGPDDEEKLK